MKLYLIIFFAFCLFSCSWQGNKNTYLEQALSLAGNNRKELEKVLNHYQADTLKLKAAQFLIENMPYYYYYTGKTLDRQMEQYKLFATTDQHPASIRDSLALKYGPFSYSALNMEYDLLNVDSAYLVENIDEAFRVWEEQPWGKHVSFENFCEYILPYRIGDEPLTYWRKQIYEKYNPLLDSIRKLPEAEDPAFAAQALLDTFRREGNIKYTEQLAITPHTGPQVCVEWKSGTCREHADAVIYVMRALGIPCGIDEVPLRGDNNSPHMWNFVLDKEQNTYMIEILTYSEIRKAPEVYLSAGKIYRHTFSTNNSLKEQFNASGLPVPSYFRTGQIKDITKIYAGSGCFPVEISGTKLYKRIKKSEPIWLCLSARQQWKPVDYGYLLENKVCFKDVKGGVVCRLAHSTKEGLEMLSDPFHVDAEHGTIRFFTPGQEMEQVTVLFKFHFFYEYFLNRMVNGIFEGSNAPDFSHADTLFQIKDEPRRLITVVSPATDKKYRYVRYKGPKGSHCNISEVAFYENNVDTVALKGKVIGTPGSFDGIHDYRNVFDGDPYTSFDYRFPDGGWSGLDLGKACSITRIAFTPRNSDNFIRKGDSYEMFYLDHEWVSAGIQTAVSDSLNFMAPKGALLYLKNHTRGKDERIFEYKEGKQIFW